ncbi:competence protein CoiA [Virgibacillus oceani]
MLQAMTKDGIPVTLAMLTKAQINQLKQDRILFYCPACKQEVIIKAGIKTIAHFAHRSIAECPSHEGGESVYHERGKLMLYQWLKSQGLSVQLEIYLPNIRQRPDLLLNIHNKRIAIEFQCAVISMEEVRKRNAGYRAADITPIWILGGNQLHRISDSHFKLNQHQLPFIHQFSSNAIPSLFFFSNETRHFIIIQDIFLTGKNLAIGKFSIQRIDRLTFKDMFKEHALIPKDLCILWEKEKYKLRLKQPHRLFGQELAWHQWLYLKGIHRELLPSIIHLPVKHQFKMNTPPWNWQSRLFLDIIDPLPVGRPFSPRKINHLLRYHHYPADSFPLIHTNNSPVSEYLDLLSRLRIIIQTSDGNFIKRKSVQKPETVEQAIKQDKQLMHVLLKQNKGMISH